MNTNPPNVLAFPIPKTQQQTQCPKISPHFPSHFPLLSQQPNAAKPKIPKNANDENKNSPRIFTPSSLRISGFSPKTLNLAPKCLTESEKNKGSERERVCVFVGVSE